jgi:hypothetical protein
MELADEVLLEHPAVFDSWGVVFYRNPVDRPEDKLNIPPFTDKLGAVDPEDWAGGLDIGPCTRCGELNTTVTTITNRYLKSISRKWLAGINIMRGSDSAEQRTLSAAGLIESIPTGWPFSGIPLRSLGRLINGNFQSNIRLGKRRYDDEPRGYVRGRAIGYAAKIVK